MIKAHKPVPFHKRKLVHNGSNRPPAWVTDAVPMTATPVTTLPQQFIPLITYKLICASGVLVHGCGSDLLVCICAAKEARALWENQLPNSTFRIHIFYPNRQRVPAADISAAYIALGNHEVAAAVARRRAAGTSNTPARSEARTAEFEVPVGRGLVVAVDVDFCQAGVVAPPDSPDLGNRLFSIDIVSQE